MMKTGTVIAAIIVSLMAIGLAYAQNSPIDKGSKIVGGGLSFTSVGDNTPDKTTIFTVNPSFGVFTSKGLFLGGSLLYQTSSYGSTTGTFYGLGPDIRYYFESNVNRREIKGSFYPYLRTSFMYRKFIEDNDYYGGYENSSFEWGAGGGIQLMFSETVGGYAEMTLGAINIKSDWHDSWSTEREFALVVGFSYFLY